MASYEEQLKELASGENWDMTNLMSLVNAVDVQTKKVDTVIASLPEFWKGESSEVLLARLKVHKNNLVKLKEFIYSGNQQVTGNAEFMCYATCDNADRKEQAQIALQNLPSTILPASVVDQINTGAEVVEVATIGPVNLAAKGVGWITDQLSGNREQAAKKAVEELNGMIDARARVLRSRNVTFDPMPQVPGENTQTAPGSTPGGGGSQYPLGPGGGSGPGGLGPSSPSGPGGGGGGLETPDGPGDFDPRDPDYPRDRDNPDYPTYPNYPNHPTNPTDPNFPGGDGGGNGPGDHDYPTWPGGNGTDPTEPTGPSVDSGMDDGTTGAGAGVRSGLGAAGLGGVGLAAGAKLAGGGLGRLGGLGGFGGMGGAGAGPSGVIGSAGTAGSGGAGKPGGGSGAGGAGGAKGSGAARPGGMMMGGQAGASSNKKGAINRLGYVAPKYEDEYEQNMPHPASRAGKRRD